MIKSRPATTNRVLWGHRSYFNSRPESWYENITTGDDTIEYSDGRKVSGKWPWKTCSHMNNGSYSMGGAVSLQITAPWEQSKWISSWSLLPKAPTSLWAPPEIDPTILDGLLKQCLDQVDLNTSDAVLLYSGVLQAVPLLGSVAKFNQIMKSVQRHVSKSLRHRPFTTVIKDLISADFIDRFVISPTLNDARKFQDACDYTLRVLDTARSRNSHAFAVNSSSRVITRESETTGRYGFSGQEGYVSYQERTTSQYSCKAFMLLEAEYDMTAVDPIKVWAQRVGLTRPLDSVWDLVPFSFVVDYFTRAGDFISHLSDEMSAVDGLRGNITKIVDIWHTASSETQCVRTPTTIAQGPAIPGGCTLDYYIIDKSPTTSRRSQFDRFRVTNQWERCMQLMSRPEDYLSVNLDLSQTRKRTLAELVIQAKL